MWSYLESKLVCSNIDLGFDITQYVWTRHKEWTITKMLIIDIDVKQWDIALPFLLGLKYNGNYHKVEFQLLMQQERKM